jgi:hypothetical protein
MSYGFIGWRIKDTTKEHLWKENTQYSLKALKTLS